MKAGFAGLGFMNGATAAKKSPFGGWHWTGLVRADECLSPLAGSSGGGPGQARNPGG